MSCKQVKLWDWWESRLPELGEGRPLEWGVILVIAVEDASEWD